MLARAAFVVVEGGGHKSLRAARRCPAHVSIAAALLALPAAIPLSGCGSSESLDTKSAAAILAASRAAAQKASTVHVHSQFYATAILRGKKRTDKPKTKLVPTSTIELQLAGERGGRARVAYLGRESEAIRIGNTLYVKSGPQFYERLEQRTHAHVPPGTWVKTTANGSETSQFAAFTEPGGELTLLLAKPIVSLTKGPTTTVKGQKAIELRTKGKLYTGAIYIAASGTPYPIEIVRHGQEPGTITFTRWSDPVTVAAPADALQLSSLEQHQR